MPADAPKSICLLRLSAIGDTCNIVPLISQLQTTFPECRLTWVIGKTEYGLLSELPGVEFIIVDKSAGRKERKKLKKILQQRKFDVLLHMHASMRANLVSRWITATRRIGFDRKRARDFQWMFVNETIAAQQQTHVVDGFVSFLSCFGLQPATPEWNIPVAETALEFAREKIAKNTLVISPCSSDRRRNFRNWSVQNYASIADYVAEKYAYQVILTGGPTELELDYGEKITALCRHRPQNLIGKTTLQQLMAILENSRMLICPDSGPAHMANAAGTPVIGLFATSNRFRTGPYNSQQWIVDRYPDALKTFLGKSTDQVRWGQRVRAPEAMDLIQVEDVQARIDELISSLQD